MAKKKKKNEEVTNTDLFKQIRKNWNGINPVSRVVESKKKKKRPKSLFYKSKSNNSLGVMDKYLQSSTICM